MACLSFDFNNNPYKTIKIEEKKMWELRDIYEKRELNNLKNKKKNRIYNSYDSDQVDLFELIDDSTINNLTTI